jgi:hypothetical protein
MWHGKACTTHPFDKKEKAQNVKNRSALYFYYFTLIVTVVVFLGKLKRALAVTLIL